jgi:Flp pilus assembly protein TadG
VSHRPGAAAVEFALILPVLALLVLGCVDLGRFAYNYIAVQNAARAGAAYGIMHPYPNAGTPAWQTAVQQAAVDEMSQQTGFVSTDLNVQSASINDGNGLWRVQVTVSYPFQTLVSWPELPTNLTLRSQVIMRTIR